MASRAAQPPSAPKKSNILVIWGDDIGCWNISYNNHGMMGYKTPSIDRIARGWTVVSMKDDWGRIYPR